MLAIIAGAMVVTGCSKKNAATIEVQVLNAGKAQVGVQVYMYDGLLGDAFLESKVHASKNIATDENGVAEFSISSNDFGAASDQATFVFETFDEDEEVTGKVATSIKKGETKKITLNQY